MTSKRKPLLEDKKIMGYPYGKSLLADYPMSAINVRNFYENLIDEGKLRVVEEVEPNKKTIPFSDIEYTSCSKCSCIIYNDYIYCPKCGSKIIWP